MSEIPRPPARLLLLASALALLTALCATPLATAAPDTFLVGDGHEGAVTTTSPTPLNHSAPLTSAATSGTIQISTGPGLLGADATAASGGSLAQTDFEIGRLVLVIQSSGFAPSPPSGDQSPITISPGNVGRFELARISALSGDNTSGMTITLEAPLTHDYGPGGAQVVAVPEFTDVELAPGGEWTANPWNGTNGGVTAFLATGTVELADASSRISARAAGFRGGLLHGGNASGCTQLDGETGGGKGEGIVSGRYPGDSTTNASRGNLANAGGGGNCSNAGGGGGGSAGPGGNGGWAYDGNRDVGGLGGSKLNYSAFTNAVFGGGGGAGDENNGNGGVGGAGGGLVFVRAQQLTGAGELNSDGAPGVASAPSASGDGAGGGGAGGVIYARFSGPADCTTASARGGNGGNEASTTGVHGPGGGGGGGVVLLQSDGGSCDTSAANGVAGEVVNGGGHRGSAPTLVGDPAFSGAVAETPPGGLAPPSVAIASPSTGSHVASSTPTISGTTSVDFALISVKIDGGPVQNTVALAGGLWSIAPPASLADGTHTISVYATAHGISSDAVASVFTVDTTPPAPPVILSPVENAAVASASPNFSGGAEPGATVEIFLAGDFVGNAVASPSGEWSYSYPAALPDAVFSFSARQIDIAGNPSAVGPARSIRIDAQAPTATIHAKPAAATNSRSATFNFDADESATFECALDGSSFGPCSAPASLSGLADGSHTFSVRARDVSGNYSPEDSHTWMIDATPPSVTISQNSPPAGVSPTFSFSSNEAVTSYRCRVAPAPFVTCSSPFGAPTLAAGSYNFELRATDAFGNTAQQSFPFVVAAIATLEPPIAPQPPAPQTPQPTTCNTAGGSPGIPAEVALLSASQTLRGVRFKVRTSGFVLASLELRNGTRLVAARVIPLGRGSRTLTLRSKRALPTSRALKVRLSAVTLSGGKSAVDASLRLSGRTAAKLSSPGSTSSGAIGSAIACAREAGARKISLNVAGPRRVKESSSTVNAIASSSQYVIATVRIVQHGKDVARRTIVLKPGRTNRIALKRLKGMRLEVGAARLELRSVTAQGVWQSFSRAITVIP